MEITFYGAAQEVTGSCYFIHTEKANILVDCGMFQGIDTETYNNELPFNARDVDVVFVTHAHIDHIGRIPLLSKEGYHGPIYAIEQTAKLMQVMLEDSANIQEHNEKVAKREGKQYKAMYVMEDVQEVMKQVKAVHYEEEFLEQHGISFWYNDAGHLLGSSSLRLTIEDQGEKKTLVFSGDIGNINQPLIEEPHPFKHCDYLFTESTYGDRLHETYDDIAKDLADVLNRTFERGGDVIIPSFAVGRTQNLLYYFKEIKKRHLVDRNFMVYVDSPMATRATEVYTEALYAVADEETKKMFDAGDNPMLFKGLEFVEDAEASRELNFNPQSKVIIASSGMCEAGRILHHLKHHLGRKEDSVIFVGFQAEHTLGRKIVQGEKSVEILNDTIKVKAEIVDYRGLSGHADQKGLLAWLHSFELMPKIVFICHGEYEAALAYQKILEHEGYTTMIPKMYEVKEL